MRISLNILCPFKSYLNGCIPKTLPSCMETIKITGVIYLLINSMFETSNYLSSIFYHSIFIPQSWTPPPHSHWPAHPFLLPVAIYLFVIDRFVYWVGGLGVWMSLCIIYKMSPSFCVTARVPTNIPATEFGGETLCKSFNQGIRL